MNCPLGILFNDFYQLTMVYSYWKNQIHNSEAVFEAYFRKNPFCKEFTIFAGLNRFLNELNNFKVTNSDIQSIKNILGDDIEDEFYSYLKTISLKDVRVYGFKEGDIVFPNDPLVQIIGPIFIVQLLETVLLNLTNYASLVVTNASHFRIAAGKDILLSEFGCRRAQGPDGAMSSSLYSYLGGFDSTSNVYASVVHGIPAAGTVSHSYISSHSSPYLKSDYINNHGFKSDLMKLSLNKLAELHEKAIIDTEYANRSELEAFVSFATSFPKKFVAIADTYNVVSSGLPNFCAVSLALQELGFKPVGIRLDSGDLAYLSRVCRTTFNSIAKTYNLSWFSDLIIIASNELTVESIYSMNSQKHEINVFGIGTNLVTCSTQPSLGMVYKLVQIDGKPSLKITENVEKSNIPFKKKCYRLFSKDGYAVFDYLTLYDEPPPEANQKILCFHPYHVGVKAYVVPSHIQPMINLLFSDEKIIEPPKSNIEIRNEIKNNLIKIRPDHLRFINPTPFKVSLSEKLFNEFHSAHHIKVREIR